MDNKTFVYQTLDSLGIPYTSYRHSAANTMEDCSEIDQKLGISAIHCKNLFLCNRQGTAYYLLLICAEKMFKTADVSKQLGVARLSFGKEDKLWEYLGTTPGAVTPMGLLFDRDRAVRLIMDRDILEGEYVVFHPCDNTESLVMKTADFMEIFLKHVGYTPTFVTIPDHYE